MHQHSHFLLTPALPRSTIQNQIEFYIERMQPDWLPSPWLIWLYRIVIGLIGGLISWRGTGLLAGLVIVLFFVLINIDRTEIKPAETIVWSWRNIKRNSVAWFIVGTLPIGFAALLIGGLRHGVIAGLLDGLLVSLQIVLMFVLIKVLMDGFTGQLLDKRYLFLPNQGIRRSARNSIFVGLVCMCIGGLSEGLFFWVIGELIGGPGSGVIVRLSDGLSIGLLVGLVAALTNGGNACIKHIVLRLLLWRARCTPRPWHYVAFLDDMYSCHLLRKVGGGYLFRHSLLRDYFASLASTPTSTFDSPSLDSGEQRM